MASARQLQALNEIWSKLVQLIGYRDVPKLSALVATFEDSDGPVNIYVSATGSDAGDGTEASPYATVQKAINTCAGNASLFKRRVTINVGPGTFAGAVIDGITTLVPDDPSSQYSGVEIRGTMVPFTPSQSTNSGTITAYTAASGSAEAVITDSTKNWAVNDLRDKFVVIKSGTGFPGTETVPPILPIVSNTATTITVRGPATAVSATYEIQDCATIFNALPAASIAAVTGSVPGVQLANAVFIMGANMGGAIGFSRLRIQLRTGVTQGINGLGMAGYRMIACQVFSNTGEGVTSPINAGNLSTGRLDSGRLDIGQCVIHAPNNATALNLAGGSSTQHQITQCSIRGLSATAASGIACAGDSKLLISFCTIVGMSNGLTFTRAHTGGVIFTSVKIDGTGGTTPNGITSVPVGSAVAQAGCSFVANNLDISNCAIAIGLQGRNCLGWLVTCTGTGNTTGINLAHGAACRVAAAVTLTGTGEVVLDGAAAVTLASMRAASPKLLTNTYGSIVYE